MNTIVVLFISLLVTILTPDLKKSAFAYDLLSGSGRADYAKFYDLRPGSMFPAQPGHIRYDFGKIGSFSNLPLGLTATDVEVATRTATNDWENWANISFSERLGNAGTGLVRLTYDPNPTRGTGATASGFNGSFAQIQFYGNWNRQSFQDILKHELGHVLGLHDLYYGVREDFVDHPVDTNQMVVNGKTYPNNASANQFNDNIMACCAAWSGTVIDNDEIAGVTWMWAGPYNQIVTGDLANEFKDPLPFGGAPYRATAPHHGYQQNNFPFGLSKTWDYRGSIVEGGSGPSYIDIYFPGYLGFTATGYSSIPTDWVHVGTPRGSNIHRFQTTTNGWFGNFELHIRSIFLSGEQLVDAWIVGGETDNFILPPDINDRVFDGLNNWPKVFGPSFSISPIPEPSSVMILVLGLVGLACLQALRKGGRRSVQKSTGRNPFADHPPLRTVCAGMRGQWE